MSDATEIATEKAMDEQAESAIRAYFERVGFPLASLSRLTGKWQALSRFGYALGHFATEAEAERHTIAYYTARPHLIEIP